MASAELLWAKGSLSRDIRKPILRKLLCHTIPAISRSGVAVDIYEAVLRLAPEATLDAINRKENTSFSYDHQVREEYLQRAFVARFRGLRIVPVHAANL